MKHKIRLELTTDELDMLASLFNTSVIVDMNSDSEYNRHLEPVNRFCHWSKLCNYLRTTFELKGNQSKYPQKITETLRALLCK